MASQHGGKPHGAFEVGSYFVAKYYQALKKHPEHVHEFYSDSSTMIRDDGESSHSATTRLQIHKLILSLNYNGIEITTVNSLDSWTGGLLVMVSGFVKINDISEKRKFVQTFFLAPQEQGYFVLNDILQFNDDGVIYPNRVSTASENIDTQLNASIYLEEPSASDSCLDEEASKYVKSVLREDDPEEVSSPILGVMDTIQEPVAPAEKPLEEPANKCYASLLQFSTRKSVLPAIPQPSFESGPTLLELNEAAKPNVQQSSSADESLSKSMIEPADESFGQQEGGIKSVFVKNLPATVTAAEIEQEFKNFGKIKRDAIFIKERKEFGACYAFLDFEDLFGAHNALQASPIEFAGREVYILERRTNSTRIAWEGRRGRGRGRYQTDAPRGRFSAWSLGRGSNQYAGSD